MVIWFMLYPNTLSVILIDLMVFIEYDTEDDWWIFLIE